jgi:hypothetical protein
VKFLMQFSPRPVFLPFGSKYLPQHTVLETLSSCSSLKVRDQVSHPFFHGFGNLIRTLISVSSWSSCSCHL